VSAVQTQALADPGAGAARSGDPERAWLESVYRPDERQLTARAVVAGVLLGGLMCLSNLYVVLKTGWSLGVTITACVVAFALFRVLRAVGLVRTDFGILENNAMGSVASSAGFMTGGGNVPALGALLILTGARPSWPGLVLWLSTIAMLGVFAAIPIKRQLINREHLAFPTGTATAETQRAMHGDSAEASRRARRLGLAALVGAGVTWFRDARFAFMPFNLPEHLGLPFRIGGLPAAQWTLSFHGSLLLVGAGALLGWRTGWSLLLGGVINWGVVAPLLHARGSLPVVSSRTIMAWAVWPGAGVLVAAGLLVFAFQWRAVARSFTSLRAVFRRRAGSAPDPLAAVECPPSWFAGGFALLGPLIVGLMAILFGFPWWAAVAALPLTALMAVIAGRVVGETDVTPTKALGPVTQLVYAGLLPGNLVANVMGANVTGGAGLHAGDLLTDLKSGYLLGARPRPQAIGQLIGALAGAAVVVPAFNLLVPDAEVLGSEAFPAPSVQVWASVSRVMVGGLGALPGSARLAALVGLVLGLALVVLERAVPERLRAWVPSPAGLGVAFIMPFYNSLSFFLGALAAEMVRRRRPATVDSVVIPVASGLIAGESILGVALALLSAGGVVG